MSKANTHKSVSNKENYILANVKEMRV